MADPLDAPRIMRRWMVGSGIGAVVSLPLLFGGIIGLVHATDHRSQATGILWTVVGGILLLTGVLLFFLFRSQADEAEWLAGKIGSDVLVRWSYSAEEKARFSTHLAQPGDFSAKYFKVYTLIITAIAVAVGAYAYWGNNSLLNGLEAAGMVGGFFESAVVLARLRTKAALRDRQGLLNGVIIGRSGVLASNGYWEWRGAGRRLSSVSFQPGDPAFVLIDIYAGPVSEKLDDAIVNGSRTLWALTAGAVSLVPKVQSHFIVPIPVPAGREQEAQQLVATLSENIHS
jgi:hypothetical protein